MTMNRRTLLAALAALPFVRGATPAEAAPQMMGGPPVPVTPEPIPVGSKYTRTRYYVGQTYAPFLETHLLYSLHPSHPWALIRQNRDIQRGDVVEIIDCFSDGHTHNYARRSVRTVVASMDDGRVLTLSKTDEGIREHDAEAYVRVISRASRGWLADHP
jgi:hypothetical protein